MKNMKLQSLVLDMEYLLDTNILIHCSSSYCNRFIGARVIFDKVKNQELVITRNVFNELTHIFDRYLSIKKYVFLCFPSTRKRIRRNELKNKLLSFLKKKSLLNNNLQLLINSIFIELKPLCNVHDFQNVWNSILSGLRKTKTYLVTTNKIFDIGFDVYYESAITSMTRIIQRHTKKSQDKIASSRGDAKNIYEAFKFSIPRYLEDSSRQTTFLTFDKALLKSSDDLMKILHKYPLLPITMFREDTFRINNKCF